MTYSLIAFMMIIRGDCMKHLLKLEALFQENILIPRSHSYDVILFLDYSCNGSPIVLLV